MTDKHRLKAAKKLRRLLDSGVLRKLAIVRVAGEFNIAPRSLYRYCKKFKIDTN